MTAGDPRRLLQAGSRGELCGPGFMDGPHVMKCRETAQLHKAVLRHVWGQPGSFLFRNIYSSERISLFIVCGSAA